MQSAYLTILRSLAIILLIATGISSICYIWTQDFWRIFGLAVIAQFILNSIVRLVLYYKANRDAQQFDLRQMELMMSQATEVTCANCKQNELVPLLVNDTENTYKCSACGKENRVIISLETALMYTPVSEKLDIDIKKLQEENGN